MVSVWLGVLPEFSFIQDNLLLAAVSRGAAGGRYGPGIFSQGNDRRNRHGRGNYPELSAAVFRGEDYDGARRCDCHSRWICVWYERALYAIITIVVVNRIADAMIEGVKFAKAAFIITDRYDEVAETVMHGVDRGLTGIYAKGMYTGKDRCLLYCVVTKKELVQLKELVGRIDENAFIIVSDAREVMGEGFSP